MIGNLRTPVGDSTRWYVVRSKPKQEERAEAALGGWGVETFLPRIRCCSPYAERTDRAKRVRPFFPGYLFARFDGRAMLHNIRYTRGVASVLGTELGPSPVDDSIVAMIRSQIDADGIVRLSLERGDHVRITEGPLTDFVGVFSRTMTSAERVRVLLSAVNGRFSVVVSEIQLEKLAAR